MSRNRFEKLSQYFHVNNNANQVPREDPAYDTLFKVRPVINRRVQCCQMELMSERDLTVDEAMVKHNGQLSMKQFMPMKPVKRGIKVWECAEVSSGFVCDFQVCTGKRQDGVTEKNLGYLVVHGLTQNFTSKNHHIFCDNFFTSVSLAEDLLNDNIYLCGTTCAICKDFPKELANNPQVKRFKQRESLFRRREDLVATVWKDKRFVNFLSTQVIRQGRKR